MLKNYLPYLRDATLRRLCLSSFVLGLTYSLTLPYLPVYLKTDLGFSGILTGLLLTGFSAASIVCGTFLSRVADRRGGHLGLLRLCSLAGVGGYAGLAFTSNWALLLLLGMTLVAFASVGFTMLFAMARAYCDRLGDGDTVMRMNIIRACFSLAWVAGPSFGAFLWARFELRAVFVAAAACFLLLWLLVAFQKAENTVAAEESAGGTTERISMLFVVGIGGFFLLMAVANSISMSLLPIYLREDHGIDPEWIGILLGFAALVEIPLMVMVAALCRRYTKLTVIVGGVLVTCGYYLTLAFAEGIPTFLFAQALSALSIAIIMGIGMSYVQDMAGSRVSSGTNVYNSASNIGNVVAGLLFGALLEVARYDRVYLLCAAGCLVALSVLIVFSRLHRPPTAPPVPAPAVAEPVAAPLPEESR
ncbi:MAG TPA: MFS transporter [Actinoplanes sp.]|nr:MFS transporter [Actinoplanes sp.]